jgi:hypothetical protein
MRRLIARIAAQVSVIAAVIAVPIVAISWSIIWMLAGLAIAVRNGGHGTISPCQACSSASIIDPPQRSALRIQSFNLSARPRAVFCTIDVATARVMGTRKHAISSLPLVTPLPLFSNTYISLSSKIYLETAYRQAAMWFVILAFAAAIITPLWYSMADDDRYMLGLLCLILWGATIMALVDRVVGYVEGGEFLELTPEATALGFTMLLVALIIWEIALLVRDPRGVLRRRHSQAKET